MKLIGRVNHNGRPSPPHRDPNDAQSDFFVTAAAPVVAATKGVEPALPFDPTALDDTALIAAMPNANLAVCDKIAVEVVARRLIEAVPALEALCRRFKGFGRLRPVREQMIAVKSLAALGGTAACAAVSRLISEGVIDPPGLPTAFKAAVVLKAQPPADIVLAYLDDEEPEMRALACQPARFLPRAVPRLIALLDDLHTKVADAAAISLGEMGRRESLPSLHRLIQTAPSPQVIQAMMAVADENCFVALGNVAEKRADLLPMIREALRDAEHPRADAVLRRLLQP